MLKGKFGHFLIKQNSFQNVIQRIQFKQIQKSVFTMLLGHTAGRFFKEMSRSTTLAKEHIHMH